MSLSSRVYAAAAFVCFVMLAPCVQAKDIQMLPPVDFNGVSCDKNTSQGGGLLYWDGTTTIRCVPGSKGDSGGNVSTTGEVQTGDSGTNCSSANAGAIRFDPGSKEFLGCNGTAWSSLGGASGSLSGWCNPASADATTWTQAIAPAYFDSHDFRTEGCACPSGYTIVPLGISTIHQGTVCGGQHENECSPGGAVTPGASYYSCLKD